MRRLIAMTLVAGTLGFVPAAAADPSEQCGNGFLPPSMTPAGVGVTVWDTTSAVNVVVCSTGTLAPAGSAEAAINAGAKPSVTIAYDGDPETSVLPCTDGYAAARADGEGVSLYQNQDGGFTSRARRKSPQEFVTSVSDGCRP